MTPLCSCAKPRPWPDGTCGNCHQWLRPSLLADRADVVEQVGQPGALPAGEVLSLGEWIKNERGIR